MGADSISSVRGRYLIFQLAERTYGIPIRDVEEIVPVAELSSVPGAPSFLSGFLDVGGRLVAVISLRRLLGLPAHEWELYTPLIILRADQPKVALEIDAVRGIVDVSDGDLIPLAEGCSFNELATDVARVDGRVVVLLATERILLDQEQKRVAELTGLARQRLAELETVSE
jgi:purine-binding chemotaxis protein CheW